MPAPTLALLLALFGFVFVVAVYALSRVVGVASTDRRAALVVSCQPMHAERTKTEEAED